MNNLDSEKAESLHQKAVELLEKSDSIDPETNFKELFETTRESLETFVQAYELDPNNHKIMQNMFALYAVFGDEALREKIIRIATQTNPNSSYTYFLLAHNSIHSIRTIGDKHYLKSIDELMKSLKADDVDGFSTNQSGLELREIIYSSQGDIDNLGFIEQGLKNVRGHIKENEKGINNTIHAWILYSLSSIYDLKSLEQSNKSQSARIYSEKRIDLAKKVAETYKDCEITKPIIVKFHHQKAHSLLEDAKYFLKESNRLLKIAFEYNQQVKSYDKEVPATPIESFEEMERIIDNHLKKIQEQEKILFQ